MIVHVRNMEDGNLCEIKVQPHETILNLKEKIQEFTKSKHLAVYQKLYHSENNLEDDKPISFYSLQNNSILYMVTQKPDDVVVTPPPAQPSFEAAASSAQAESHVIDDESLEKKVKEITELLLPRQIILDALFESNNDINSAIDYLIDTGCGTYPDMSGIQEVLDSFGKGPINNFTSDASEIVFQTPQEKEVLLILAQKYLANNNNLPPEEKESVLNLVQQLLANNNLPHEESEAIDNLPNEKREAINNFTCDEREAIDNLTREEREAIGRLMARGYTEVMCVEVYLSCKKDESEAAKKLLESKASNTSDDIFNIKTPPPGKDSQKGFNLVDITSDNKDTNVGSDEQPPVQQNIGKRKLTPLPPEMSPKRKKPNDDTPARNIIDTTSNLSKARSGSSSGLQLQPSTRPIVTDGNLVQEYHANATNTEKYQQAVKKLLLAFHPFLGAFVQSNELMSEGAKGYGEVKEGVRPITGMITIWKNLLIMKAAFTKLHKNAFSM